MGRFPSSAPARIRLRLAPLPLVLALFTLGGCGGTERDSSVDSSPEPARVFLAGDGALTVVDADAGRAEVHELDVLAPGDPLYRIVLRGDGLVVYGGDTYVLDPELRSPPRKLGDSWFFIPSAKPDRVWLAVLDRTSPETVRAVATVREVTADGRVTSLDVHPPGGRWPVAAVGDELVFEDHREGGLELWNPSTRTFTRRLPGASRGPGQGDLLAWCEREGLVLHVLDVRSGRDRTFGPPKGFAAFDCWAGAFSPDGDTLAVPARAVGYDSERSLALVDLKDGDTDLVPESTVGPVYVFVAWSSRGDRVFLSGGSDGDRDLVQYRLGGPRAGPVAVEVRDFYGMAAR